MATYLFKTGNGNDGNHNSRFLVTVTDQENAYAAIRALLANEYIAAKGVRRWIIGNTLVDGEPAYGLRASVIYGPKGEQSFGASWLTAELQPLSDEDAAYERDQWGRPEYALLTVLDRPARRQYREYIKESAARLGVAA